MTASTLVFFPEEVNHATADISPEHVVLVMSGKKPRFVTPIRGVGRAHQRADVAVVLRLPWVERVLLVHRTTVLFGKAPSPER